MTLCRWLLMLIALVVMPLQADVQAKHTRLILAGPPASVSNPLLHMLASGALDGLADDIRFVQWSTPDQLRALVMGGSADLMALPTNVAANLYNRGVPLQLQNVSVWGVLWMLSRDPELKTLADFRGKEIAMPFRADMPDILFSFLVERQGLDPRKDFRLRYTATPMDAMQLLVMRRVDHALLAEPAVSMALRKTRSFPLTLVAPELFRSVDLQAEWGRVLSSEARIPQAGIAALGGLVEEPEMLASLETAYAASMQWCNRQPQACGELVAEHIPLLSAEAVADSVTQIPDHYATALEARPELEALFQLLLEREPASLGGRLPDAGFYGGRVRP